VEKLAFEKQHAATKYEELKKQLEDVQDRPPPYLLPDPFINATASGVDPNVSSHPTGAGSQSVRPASTFENDPSHITSDHLDGCYQSLKSLLDEVDQMKSILTSGSRNSANSQEFTRLQSRWHETKRNIEAVLSPPTTGHTQRSTDEQMMYYGSDSGEVVLRRSSLAWSSPSITLDQDTAEHRLPARRSVSAPSIHEESEVSVHSMASPAGPPIKVNSAPPPEVVRHSYAGVPTPQVENFSTRPVLSSSSSGTGTGSSIKRKRMPNAKAKESPAPRSYRTSSNPIQDSSIVRATEDSGWKPSAAGVRSSVDVVPVTEQVSYVITTEDTAQPKSLNYTESVSPSQAASNLVDNLLSEWTNVLLAGN
jgi:hypothetical protein